MERPFAEVCQQLADAMVAVLEHEDCPSPLEGALIDLYIFVLREYGTDLASDVRNRFASMLARAYEQPRTPVLTTSQEKHEN